VAARLSTRLDARSLSVANSGLAVGIAMFIKRSWIVACALGAMAVTAGAAQAGVEHMPVSGTPAYEVNVPDTGWLVKRDDSGNLYIFASSQTGGVVLNIVSGEGMGDTPLDKLAELALSAAKAQPYSRVEDASIGGIKGKAFYSRIGEGETAVNFRLILVHLDATHIASEAAMRGPKMGAEEGAALDRLVASIHFIR
jgi:hypothetical protein